MKKTLNFSIIFLGILGTLYSCKKQEIQPGDLVPKTVIDDLSLPSFTLSDGTKLHLETFGDPSNPVLIILHGGPGNSYKPYLKWKSLSDEYYMVYWDQRGAGLSERVPNEELVGPQYLKDLNEIGNHFSPDNKFYLIGHSWGGAYASYYVQNYPERVEKLVLIEPGPMNKAAMENTTGATVDFFSRELQAFLNNSDYLVPGNDEKADYFRMTSKFEEQTIENSDTRQGFRSNYHMNDWRGLWDKSYTADFTAGIKENYLTNVLFIAGTTERLGAEAIHFNLYEGQVFVIDGADHAETVSSPLTLPKIRAYFNS
jgi:pimeloyl-ACP methyl ester carboxylesterase